MHRRLGRASRRRSGQAGVLAGAAERLVRRAHRRDVPAPLLPGRPEAPAERRRHVLERTGRHRARPAERPHRRPQVGPLAQREHADPAADARDEGHGQGQHEQERHHDRRARPQEGRRHREGGGQPERRRRLVAPPAAADPRRPRDPARRGGRRRARMAALSGPKAGFLESVRSAS